MLRCDPVCVLSHLKVPWYEFLISLSLSQDVWVEAWLKGKLRCNGTSCSFVPSLAEGTGATYPNILSLQKAIRLSVLLIWWQLYNSPLRVISVVKLSSSQPVPSGPFLNLSDLFLIDGLNLPCSISNVCTIQTWQHSFKCKLCRRLFIHRNGLYISRRWWSRSGTKSKHRSRFLFFFLNCTVVHF